MSTLWKPLLPFCPIIRNRTIIHRVYNPDSGSLFSRNDALFARGDDPTIMTTSNADEHSVLFQRINLVLQENAIAFRTITKSNGSWGSKLYFLVVVP